MGWIWFKSFYISLIDVQKIRVQLHQREWAALIAREGEWARIIEQPFETIFGRTDQGQYIAHRIYRVVQ